MSSPQRQIHNASFETAAKALPGASLGGYSLDEDIRLIYAEGSGPRFRDVQGREYIDYVGGAGALILGHAHPAVVEASQAQIARGAHMFGSLSDVAIKLADRLVTDIPCAEKIAFATTGSEATAYAMRLARAFTGKDKILKFEGAYHGNHDYALVSTFPKVPGNYPQGSGDTAGQPQATVSTMLVAPYNDLDAASQIVAEHGKDIAAIIVECVQRIIPAEPDFLAGLRKLCNEQGIVLIFDEVVTGFRVEYGGAQARYGVTPDLATYGKVVGGGGPLSCVAGKAEIIELADPNRKGEDNYTYFNGTLHGNPVAAAATLAMLDELSKPGTYERLNAYADQLCLACQEVLDRHGIPAIAEHTGSLWQILFMDNTPRSQADMLNGDAAAMHRLDSELMKLGIYALPGVRRFVSCVHGEAELSDTLESLDVACKEFRQ